MGRPRDEEAWEQVTKHENGTLTCKRCGKKISKGTSIKRIRDHLGTEKGKGTTLCEGSSVPGNQGGNSTAAMPMAASSDPMEVVDGMDSFQEARQAYHTIFDSIPYSSYNHQNVPPANNLFEEARYADHTIDGNITNSSNHHNSSNHQNVPPANNLFEDGEAVNHLLPRDLLELDISYNKQWSGGICDALSFKAPSSLRKIDVERCPKLERLFCLTGSCYFCKHLHNLHSLTLRNLERLEFIWIGRK